MKWNQKSEQIDTSGAEFQNALNLIRYTHQSIFLTGKAGTGKSTFLRYVCANTKKKNVVLAPTGLAAINVGGQTIHSFFKIPFHPLLPDDPQYSMSNLRKTLKYSKRHIKLLQQLELIVIDEISMVRADIIDFIDRVLRVCCGNLRTPFGGKQMLFIGDVFQLEPVVTADERNILERAYPNAFFFSAHVFRNFQLVSIELRKVFRQQDPVFIRILDHIRTDTVSPDELSLLNMRCDNEGTESTQTSENLNIVLATRRDTVDFINQSHLDRLPGESVILRGNIQGDFPESALPTLMELELKCGAQVIFVKNDNEKRWVNGTLGTVTSISEDGSQMEVAIAEGNMVDITPVKWENVRYEYNELEKKVEEHVLGEFTQFPLRLAWAITIHKSQGLTFRHATIDFSGGTFAGGQAYVALSRCTSLEGLKLNKPITPTDIFVRKEITTFARQFNDPRSVEEALQHARAEIEYHEANSAFDRGDMGSALDHFFRAIHTSYVIEQSAARRLLQRKLHSIAAARRQAEEARMKLKDMEQRLQKYADEYFRMGNECIEANCPKAALANYAKAIELNPTHLEARINMAVTLCDGGRLDEALHLIEETIGLSKSFFRAWLQKGAILIDMGQWELALRTLRHAQGLNDDSAQVHELLAECYTHLDDRERAELHLRLAKEKRNTRNKKRK